MLTVWCLGTMGSSWPLKKKKKKPTDKLAIGYTVHFTIHCCVNYECIIETHRNLYWRFRKLEVSIHSNIYQCLQWFCFIFSCLWSIWMALSVQMSVSHLYLSVCLSLHPLLSHILSLSLSLIVSKSFLISEYVTWKDHQKVTGLQTTQSLN